MRRLVAGAMAAAMAGAAGCGEEAPSTHEEACAAPYAEGLPGGDRPSGGEAWLSADFSTEERAAIHQAFVAWQDADPGAWWWVRTLPPGDRSIRRGALNVFPCPEGAPRLAREGGPVPVTSVRSGDYVAIGGADRAMGAHRVRAAAAHEIGHAMGLGHSGERGDLMWPLVGATWAPSGRDLERLASARAGEPAGDEISVEAALAAEGR